MITPKQRARQRIRNERARNRAKSFNYITTKRGVGQTEVRCKISGTPIKSLKVIHDLSLERNVKGRTIIREAVMLGENNNYAEIMIDFSDGSRHHTPVCKSIVNKLKSSDLETIYAADMEQWRIEEDAGGGEANWSYLADRIITGYRRVK